FKEIPGIMEGTGKPEYDKCVEISTKASLREMMLPGLLTIGFPLVITFLPMLFGMDKLMIAEMLGGYMAGVTVSGVLWAIFQNNAGGAWDNAKKSFEAGVMINGEMTHKGSAAHEAAITGDTVGDPFKDTSGPSMNILIKLTCLIGLVIAPILGEGTVTHAESTSEEMLGPQPSELGLNKPVQSALISTKATSFTFDKKNKSVSSFTFSNVQCQDEAMICKELIQISEKEEMSFKSLSDVGSYSGDLDFDKQVNGILVIGGNKFKSEFLFNVRKENNSNSFIGMLMFNGGDVFKNTNGMITIMIKGKQ
ncbi:MAG: hypothetical protein ACI8ZH_000978, partial [Flavobacteriales bacterium]